MVRQGRTIDRNETDFESPIPEEWMEDAACLDVGPSHFFSDIAGGDSYKTARKICGGCPVVEECLEFALKTEEDAHHHDRHGWYGNMSPRQRYNVALERRRD